MSGSISLEPEWLQNNNTSNKVTTPSTVTPTTSLKLPLAAHRYGREEMLLFYSEDVPFPSDIAYLPTLTRKQIVPPLAISPLSPLEQQVLSGRVNSDSMRGRGTGRGGRGRGRGGGRPDYYREPYHRSNSESDKTDDTRVVNDKGATSRAIQDTNWRSSGSSGPPKEPAWVGKSWSTSSPVKGGVWNDEGTGVKKHWQPLPEWATAPTTADSNTVQHDSKEPPPTDCKDDDLDAIEDVFETAPVTPPPISQAIKTSRTESADSVEEMERRFKEAAESILSTEDEETPVQSPVVGQSPHDQWYYQDPQGDTQGPFSNQEMNSWFTAGYFTMSLHVRRSCDEHMLPLGQVIRIWGRTPFIPGPMIPPLSSNEPFWQQVFQQQHQLFPEVLVQSKPHPPPPVWGTKDNVGGTDEEQWPDLGGRTRQMEEEERRQAEELARQQRALELKRQLEEEEKRKRYEAEQLRIREEEEKRKREEELRLLELERIRLEEERILEERKRREEQERIKRIEEEKRAQEERLERERLEQELYQRLQIQEHTKVDPPSVKPPQTLSLIDIQKEEAREMARQQELLYQQQLLELQQQQSKVTTGTVPWNSGTSKPGGHTKNKTASFLEIQYEQEQQVGIVGGATTSRQKNIAVTSSSVGTSWSKITAGSKPQAPPVAWTSHHQMSTVQRTTPTTEHQPMSFWEECAQDSMRTGKGRGRHITTNNGRPISKSVKEEDKVRQLFAATSPNEEFTEWCKKELVKYNSDVDAVTFVNLLMEVESTYEVHDYIKSFLGESDEIHSFAKQFLERRQKLKVYSGSSSQSKKGGASNSSKETWSAASSSRNSKKKKKGSSSGGGKMTKVSPSSVLGFTVNAAERPNAGEIQSAKDAL